MKTESCEECSGVGVVIVETYICADGNCHPEFEKQQCGNCNGRGYITTGL